MGEIKSTLELAMERTKNLVMTREEREEMARKENETRVQAAIRKLLGGELRPADLAEQVARLEAERPEFPWREVACRASAVSLVPGENEAVVLEGLRTLGFARIEELEQLVADALAESAQIRANASERLLATLAAGGIRGSAVVANPEMDFVWQQDKEILDDSFQVRRDRILE